MKRIMLTLTSLLLYISAVCQINTTFSIKGILQDSVSKQAIPFATVSLLTGDKQIKSAVTQQDGGFFLSGLTAGNYTLAFTSVGYGAKHRAIKFDSLLMVDLGNILLVSGKNRLSTVTISALKPLVKRSADKFSYDLQSDPDSRVLNLLEIMPKIPLLSVDGNDNLLMRGRADFRVFIDGKPSGMLERNLKEVLRTMPASTIKSIEVITTSGARFEAEGAGGIINIITMKRLTDGYNATVNLSGRAPLGGPGFGASLNTRVGKWNLNVLTGGGLFFTPKIEGFINRQIIGTTPSQLLQYNSRRSDSRNGYVGAEFSYDIDSLQLISGKISPAINNFNGSSPVSSRSSNGEAFDMANTNSGNGSGLEASLNYQLGFRRSPKRLFSLAYRFYDFNDHQENLQQFYNKVNYQQDDYIQTNNSGSREHTLQTDYIQPLKHFTLETGAKAIWRDNSSNFQFLTYDQFTGQYVTEPDRSKSFSGRQDIYSTYSSLNFSNKVWEIRGGFRVEHTAVTANFSTAHALLKRNYTDVVPSIAISKKLGKGDSRWNMGFSQRIQRPGISLLNPFVDRSNPGVEYAGNPQLNPAKTTSFETGYSTSAKGSFSVNLAYSRTGGVITPLIKVDQNTRVTRVTYGNTGSVQYVGATVNVAYPLTKIWSANLNGNIAYNNRQGEVNGEPVSRKGWTGELNFSSSLRPGKAWRIGASVNYFGGDLTLQERSNAFLRSGLNISKSVLNDKLTIAAFINNPFVKYRVNRINAYGPMFNENNESRRWFRTFGGSINYNFGSLKGGVKQTSKSVNNTDLINK